MCVRAANLLIDIRLDVDVYIVYNRVVNSTIFSTSDLPRRWTRFCVCVRDM